MHDCGAHVSDSGVRFCVWAPFADAVAVTGDFSNWSDDGVVMARGEDGCWFVDVKDAGVGQEYAYIIHHQGQILRRNDPRALQLTASGESSVIVDPHFDWGEEHYELPSLSQIVIYELHVGTFARADPATPGTFHDAITKLDYLVELGVNVIEVMPCNAMWTDRWWGYTPDNIYAVESAYGGRRAFMEFVRAAHQKGLGVILDVVYNHLSEGPASLWQFDGWSQDGGGGIYFYNDYRASTPWGNTRPDYGRPEVRQFITDNAKMWLRDCHVDGLRVDATLFIRNFDQEPWDHLDHEIPDGWKLLQEINTAAREVNSKALLIAEDLQGNEWITKPVSEGGAGFNAQWDPILSEVLREELGPKPDESRQIDKMHIVLERQTNGNPFERVIFTESHDADAEASGGKRFDEAAAPGDASGLYARKRTALAAAIALTTPGIPMLFQGQEFEEISAFSHYAALDWSRAEKFAGILTLHKHLIALRQNRHHNTAGLLGPHVDTFLADASTRLVAYHRWDKGGPSDDVVVVANFANQLQKQPISFPAPGTWWVRLNTDWDGYSDDFTNLQLTSVEARPDPHDANHFMAEISIAPYGVLIFSQDS